MVGRPTVPNSVKKANGTLRKCRLNTRAPKNSGLPKCPFDRGSIAAAKWKEIVAGLERLGIIDKLDGSLIQAFCTNWQRAIEADNLLKAEGLVLTLPDGKRQKHPAATVAADCWSKVRAIGNDLGLNHLSRQRLQTNIPTDSPQRMRRERYLEAKYLSEPDITDSELSDILFGKDDQ